MATASKAIEPGAEMPPVVKRLNQEKINIFESVSAVVMEKDIAPRSEVSLHTDEELAKQAGFTSQVASGMMAVSFLNEALRKFFGADTWNHTGKLAVTFIAPAYAGDEVSAKGVVKEKAAEGDGARVSLEVWCEKQDGTKTAVGAASALVK